MATYSQAIGDFARGLALKDIPGAVVDKTKLVFLDTLGVALASSTMDFGAMVTKVAQTLGGAPKQPHHRHVGQSQCRQCGDRQRHAGPWAGLRRHA